MSDERYEILATAAETGGAFGLVTCTLPPYSAGPDLHRHPAVLEGCVVLAGLVAMTVDETTQVLGVGELRLLRPGSAHTWWNPSATPARLLLIYAPGASAGELRRLARGAPGQGAGCWDTS